MDKKEITKEDFERYEEVRQSGRTNMWDVKNVEMLSGLSKDKIIEIMDNYEKFMKKFLKIKSEEEEPDDSWKTSPQPNVPEGRY